MNVFGAGSAFIVQGKKKRIARDLRDPAGRYLSWKKKQKQKQKMKKSVSFFCWAECCAVR